MFHANFGAYGIKTFRQKLQNGFQCRVFHQSNHGRCGKNFHKSRTVFCSGIIILNRSFFGMCDTFFDSQFHLSVFDRNISFDIRMLQQECQRIDKFYSRERIKTFCTMKDISHIKDLPKKRPRLGLLYLHLFGKEIKNAHDAMADIQATKDCFVELAKRGEIVLG